MSVQAVSLIGEVNGGSSISGSFSRTGTGPVAILIMARQSPFTTQGHVSNVTVDAAPIDVVDVPIEYGDGQVVNCWFLDSVGSGSHPTVVTLGGTITYGAVAVAVVLDGTYSARSFTGTPGGGYTASPSFAVTPVAASSLIVGCVVHGNPGAMTPMGSFVDQFNVAAFVPSGLSQRAAVSTLEVTGTTPVTVGFNAAGSEGFQVGALLLDVVSGGGGGTSEITVESADSGARAGGEAQSTPALALTVPANTTGMIVQVSVLADDKEVTAVTWNGSQALTEFYDNIPGDSARYHIHHKLAPAPATSTVTPTLSDTDANGFYHAAYLEGVLQSDAVETPVMANGGSGVPSVTVPSTTEGQMIIAICRLYAADTAGIVADSPGMELLADEEVLGYFYRSRLVSMPATAGSTVVQFVTTPHTWRVLAFAVNPAEGGGGDPDPGDDAGDDLLMMGIG